MKKYESLFFDLDNTLWDFDRNSFESLKIAFNHFKLSENGIAFELFYRFYSENNDRVWEEYRQNKITKQELIKKRFEMTFEVSGIIGVDPFEFNDFYLNEMPKQQILIEGAIETLQLLKKKNYSMHIVTNGFKEVQIKKLENSGLDVFFGSVIISEKIKAPKPSAAIFEYALKSTNSKKKKSLMIGDSWEVDIIGAMNFGIDQMHYVQNMSIEFDEDELNLIKNSKTKTYRINTLKSLIKFL